MALPDISIKQRQGGLGRVQPTEDGISGFITQGVAIVGKLDLNRTYEVRSLQAVEQLGITASAAGYATVHYQLSEFYRLSPGAVLLLMVTDAASMADMADRTKPYAKKLLTGGNGRIKQLAFHLNPAGGAALGLVADVLPAVAKAQALAAEEWEQHRPVVCLLAGHGLPADLSTAPDLTTKNAPNVALVVGADYLQQPDEPAVGALLGMVSSVQVHICIGWVGGCQLATDGSFVQAGLSNGVANEDLLPGDLAGLHGKGYICVLQHPGADGFFFSDSPTCTSPASDTSQLESVRTLNKMARLVRLALLPQLKGPLLLQADGTLQPQVRAELEERGGSALNVQMSRPGELSAYDVYIDPAQVLSNGQAPLNIDFSGVPVGVSRTIAATIGLVTSL